MLQSDATEWKDDTYANVRTGSEKCLQVENKTCDLVLCLIEGMISSTFAFCVCSLLVAQEEHGDVNTGR